MKTAVITLLLILSGPGWLVAQQSEATLRFVPVFGGKTVTAGDCLVLNDDTVCIETLKFFVSGVRWGMETGRSSSSSVYLFDLEKPETWNMAVAGGVEKKLHLAIGLDSLTNVSGAMGGALDPTNGMYWTWQSGYIHFKMEGTSTRCNIRKHAFHLHLGGYAHPYGTLREMEFTPVSADIAVIEIRLDQWLAGMAWDQHCDVMSPGPVAAALCDRLQTVFVLRP